MGVKYATREQVLTSLEIAHTSRAGALIDRFLEKRSRAIEGYLHRRFYPEIKTIKLDWPNYSSANAWQLWLPEDSQLISLTSLTSGGTSIPTGDVLLRRGDDIDEPPYSYIEINLSTASAFSAGNTFQQSAVAVGLTGWNNTSTAIVHAVLGAAINNSVTTCVLNPSSGIFDIGVGALILIGTERMFITNRQMSDTGQNLVTNMTAQKADTIVDVADGTLFAVDEVILLDAERMRITDIAGNNLIVERAYDGTPLAAHTAPVDIYALRTCTIQRGVLGTTAASHSQNDPIYTHDFVVNELAIAETVVALEQNASAYARIVGSGANARESVGRGLEDLREQALTTYGLKTRSGTI